ncbi:MAG: 3-oxoadipyl-CoA thiolase, partial [Myxococcales bacterium]|nr:3-oxoadipyl-CoA thiolase [Myxococcales bacterium]
MRELRDAFLVDAVRTPIGRYRGGLASIRPDDLAAHLLGAIGRRSPALFERVDQVVMGDTNQAGEDNRDVARMAALLAGMPYELPAVTVNR